ncbi:MAG: hypothetical protein IT169_02100 [Bryobacterales bacterium]|nr:hypothetical protein [Bryobacterales bacterium]
MKTRLRFLNLILILACGFTVWQVRANHLEMAARERKTFEPRAKSSPAGEVKIVPIPPAEPPSAYVEVATRMMFAQDRNPNVVEEKKPEPEPKKMPALPVLYGVINFGDGPIAMLSQDDSGKQGSYKVGDTIGEFKLVKISKEKITFSWDGQEIEKTADQLKAQAKSAPKKTTKETAAKAPAPVAPPPAPTKPGPGKETGGRERACQPGEKAPDGTVVDGWVKRTTYSPMGAVCFWEPVAK